MAFDTATPEILSLGQTAVCPRFTAAALAPPNRMVRNPVNSAVSGLATDSASGSTACLPLIAIAAKSGMALQGLTRYLKASSFRSVAVMPSTSELTAAISDLQPSAVIIEISTQTMEGFEAITAMRNLQLAIKILVFADYTMPSLVKMIFKSGAHGYLLSMPTQAVMIAALESILSGDHILDRQLAYIRPTLTNVLTARCVTL